MGLLKSLSLGLFFTVVYLLNMPLAQAEKRSDCSLHWQSHSRISSCEWLGNKTKIRAGFIKENSQVPFQGNVLYFEGLGDSMINHDNLFLKLATAGFRVIAFDYLGQGGSEGNMASTRMQWIVDMGEKVYAKYARATEKQNKPLIIGWSTGGLAAYIAAVQNKAQAVVMIAPGIVPRLLVGENNILKGQFNSITMKTLTSDQYLSREEDPHLDPIKPSSAAQVLPFALNLVSESFIYRYKAIARSIPGVVFIGGEDNYVYPQATLRTMQMQAPHMAINFYPHSKHELHNEKLEIREDVHQQILNFLLAL